MRARIFAAIPAILLVLVSLWEIVAARCDATSVPGDRAWNHAAEVVRAAYQPGDLIVFAPRWVDPVGRLHLGDLIPVDMAARMDAARYAHIWELSIRGAQAPDTVGLERVSNVDIDGIAVRLYRQPPAVVLADVRDALPAAKQEGGAGHVVVAEVGFEPHRCIQVTPVPGRPVKITMTLPLGTQLVGYAGLADVFTRRDIRAPGSLAVEIGGKQVAHVTPGVDDGWVRFQTPTTPGPADVTFIASADAPQRQICFAAEARQ